MSVWGLPRPIAIPPSQDPLPLPTMRSRSRWIARFWLCPPRSETAWPPAPVMVRPRRVTNFDRRNRRAACVHRAVPGVTTTLPGGAAGSAWITMRSASVASPVSFLPEIETCS